MSAAPDLRAAELRWVRTPDDVQVPVRVMRGGGAPLVLTHGIQSHSGWFERCLHALSREGFDAYAFDRRGSGQSREERGHCDDFMQLVSEVAAVVRYARETSGARQAHLLGHCYGALPAAAFACVQSDEVRSLVLATPALFTRTDLRLPEKLRVFAAVAARRRARIPIPLDPREFSDVPEHVAFIERDPDVLSDATAQLFFQTRRMRRFVARHAARLSIPVFLALAERDAICDNAATVAFHAGLPGSGNRLVRYTDAVHVLELSRAREVFFEDLLDWMRG